MPIMSIQKLHRGTFYIGIYLHAFAPGLSKSGTPTFPTWGVLPKVHVIFSPTRHNRILFRIKEKYCTHGFKSEAFPIPDVFLPRNHWIEDTSGHLFNPSLERLFRNGEPPHGEDLLGIHANPGLCGVPTL